MLQCTACHDPHDDQFGRFLAMPNDNAALCRQCHAIEQFDATPHATSGLTWNGQGPDPWPHTEFPDVRTNACMNCHRSHHSGSGEELLMFAREEENCFVCHNGSVAPFNMQAVFEKFSSHPVEQFEGEHEPGENPMGAADHVECADCHNPHRARLAPAEAPFVMGVLEGVTGIDANGVPVDEARFEYEVCFKCHTQEQQLGMRVIERQVGGTNLRQEFNPASPSFHPVEGPGRGGDVPSLLSPYNTGSVIYCSDCHGNNNEQQGAVGSAGPHGSDFEYLLKRQYRTSEEVAESPEAYALCYGCHSRESILWNRGRPARSATIRTGSTLRRATRSITRTWSTSTCRSCSRHRAAGWNTEPRRPARASAS